MRAYPSLFLHPSVHSSIRPSVHPSVRPYAVCLLLTRPLRRLLRRLLRWLNPWSAPAGLPAPASARCVGSCVTSPRRLRRHVAASAPASHRRARLRWLRRRLLRRLLRRLRRRLQPWQRREALGTPCLAAGHHTPAPGWSRSPPAVRTVRAAKRAAHGRLLRWHLSVCAQSQANTTVNHVIESQHQSQAPITTIRGSMARIGTQSRFNHNHTATFHGNHRSDCGSTGSARSGGTR